jgi:hypothetical protein
LNGRLLSYPPAEKQYLIEFVRFHLDVFMQDKTYRKNKLFNDRIIENIEVLINSSLQHAFGKTLTSDDFSNLDNYSDKAVIGYVNRLIPRVTWQLCEMHAFIICCFRLLAGLLEQEPIQVPRGTCEAARTGSYSTSTDITDEMAQELIDLEKGSAYVKAVQERNGEQRVLMHKIKLLPKPSRKIIATGWGPNKGAGLGAKKPIEIGVKTCAIARAHALYCRKRTAIEEELRTRQKKWQMLCRDSANDISDEPPPTYS